MSDQPTNTVPTLPEIFDHCIIGRTIATFEDNRIVYSLSRLLETVQKDRKLPDDQARQVVADIVQNCCRKHGDRAPVFVDDELASFTMFAPTTPVEQAHQN